MLFRAPVSDLKNGRVDRAKAYVVIVMLHYPRFVRVELRDEYLRALAPDKELFSEFKALERATGDHDGAFEQARYEERFWLGKDGRAALARLSAMAKERDVALLCQCEASQCCHADLLLIMARLLHDAPTAPVAKPYATFTARVETWKADF